MGFKEQLIAHRKSLEEELSKLDERTKAPRAKLEKLKTQEQELRGEIRQVVAEIGKTEGNRRVEILRELAELPKVEAPSED